jgi:NTP pyrophosphatase (non-canonical NTP hydrolase)
MNNLERQIVSWNKTTFPNATREAFLLKIKSELVEAMVEADSANEDALVHELADVAILSISYLARFHNSSLYDAINTKFKIVASREWGAEDEHGDKVKK